MEFLRERVPSLRTAKSRHLGSSSVQPKSEQGLEPHSLITQVRGLTTPLVGGQASLTHFL